MAKYNIRQPFAIHLEKFTDSVRPDGAKMRTRTEQSFFPGQAVELTNEEALAHLHKLEPADADSTKFLKDYHAKQAAAAAARVQEDQGPSLAEQVSTSVVAALIAAGVITKPTAK